MTSQSIALVGPLPNPIHGQSLAMKSLVDKMSSEVDCVVFDTSEFLCSPMLRTISRIARHFSTGVHMLRDWKCVYISINSNGGIWLTLLLILLARLRSHKLMLHFHAYSHIRDGSLALRTLMAIAGEKAVFVVLGKSMKDDLYRVCGGGHRILVLNNSGLIDPELLKIPERKLGHTVTLGHMSNLTIEKGLSVVIDFAVACLEHGIDLRLHLAGPVCSEEAKSEINRAKKSLGDRLSYWGAVYSEDKRDFFQSVDVFVFPSKYRNEAEPLVVLESLAAGIPCVASDVGCIAGDIGSLGGVAIPSGDSFVEDALSYLDRFLHSASTESKAARTRYGQLLDEHEIQMAELMDYLKCGT